MENKFNMSREQNIFLAKRNVVDYIYKSAKLEGINVTFPETQAIFEGVGVEGAKVEDIIKINNLKRAWQFLFDTLENMTDFDYMCRLNMIVGAEGIIYGAGKLRTYDVKISGTDWRPQIPFEFDIRNEMADILEIKNPTERSITLMLWAMRKQIFMDGNKRTAMLIANKEMILGGCGVISVPDNQIKRFYELLIEFYETNNMDKLKQFVYDRCIDGINF